MATPEQLNLLSELLDGKLTEEGWQRLSEMLRDNPEMQDEYRRFMKLHALLHLDLSSGQLRLPPVLQLKAEAPGPIETVAAAENAATPGIAATASRIWNSWRISAQTMNRGRRLRWLSAFGALAASVAIVSWSQVMSSSSHRGETDQAATSDRSSRPTSNTKTDNPSVALLGQASRAVWGDPKLKLSVGTSLEPGKFVLNQGLVQIEFFSGASVIIEAPANFEIVSAKRIVCNLGKIRAHVPTQAVGFTIWTPSYSAVDLGTEFTVQVEPTGISQFHVLEGEVDLWGHRRDPGTPAQRLTAGKGVRASASGQLTEVPDVQPAFVGGEQMLKMATAALRERYDSWKKFSQRIRSAPDLILYYGFDGHQPWERVLRNDGHDKIESLDGAIVGCQWTAGRWKGKQALEFKRTGDRVRVNVPGEFDSVTYAAWIRIEGLERWLSSLMLTDGHQLGELHWQMTDQGQLMLGVKAEQEKSHDFYSPSVIGPRDLGRWVHIACVYNGKDGYVSHVVDGVEVSRESIRIPTKLRIGPAEIGNWVPQDLREYRIRSLNGRIDEFLLFKSPLTTEQIREIYEAGKPQS